MLAFSYPPNEDSISVQAIDMEPNESAFRTLYRQISRIRGLGKAGSRGG
jgi:hypothetical protein